MPGARVDRDDLAALPRAAAVRRGRRRSRRRAPSRPPRLAPLDEQVEVGALRCVALVAETPRARSLQRSLMPRAPPRAGRRRASSARRGGSAAPRRARICRPSSAFVPSSRTTIGSSIDIWSSAARIPRATSSQRVIPPKMLKKIERTSWSRVITSSASTTPSRIAAAAEVAEVRRPAARDDDDVHRRHRQPGAVAEDPDRAVELHVRHALLARERLQRVRRRDVAHLGDVRDDGRARCRRP